MARPFEAAARTECPLACSSRKIICQTGLAAYFAHTDASEPRRYSYYGGQDIGRLHMLWDHSRAVMP